MVEPVTRFIYALLPHVPLITLMNAAEAALKPTEDALDRPYLKQVAEKLSQGLGTEPDPQTMSKEDLGDFLRHVPEEDLRLALRNHWAKYAAACGPQIRRGVDHRLGTRTNICPMASSPMATLTAFALDEKGEKEILGTFIESIQRPGESLITFTHRFIHEAADAYVKHVQNTKEA